ncbi:MAG: hypothetical protein U0237_07780 [Thermoleophilia bacterium]
MTDDPLTPSTGRRWRRCARPGSPFASGCCSNAPAATRRPETFSAALERLASLGHAHVAFDRDAPGRDPEPFEARMWRAVD